MLEGYFFLKYDVILLFTEPPKSVEMETKVGTFEIKNPGIDKAYVKCFAKHSRPAPDILWLIGEFDQNTIFLKQGWKKKTFGTAVSVRLIPLFLFK